MWVWLIILLIILIILRFKKGFIPSSKMPLVQKMTSAGARFTDIRQKVPSADIVDFYHINGLL